MPPFGRGYCCPVESTDELCCLTDLLGSPLLSLTNSPGSASNLSPSLTVSELDCRTPSWHLLENCLLCRNKTNHLVSGCGAEQAPGSKEGRVYFLLPCLLPRPAIIRSSIITDSCILMFAKHRSWTCCVKFIPQCCTVLMLLYTPCPSHRSPRYSEIPSILVNCHPF